MKGSACPLGRSARVKRAFDVLLAVITLVVFAPILLLVALLVMLDLGRPVFFRQVRAGRHGVPFQMYKFRTMRESVGADGAPLPDKDRVTGLGRLLRKMSIDELPELVNIVRGDMSFVGPRPLLVEYLPNYSDRHRRRHDVLPGITGLAQINGRQHLRFSERLELDVWYADNWTLCLDLKILALTLPRALFSSGVITGQDVADVDDVGLSDHGARNHPPTE